MGVLILGLVIFMAVHSVSIFAAGWRDGMVARLGEVPFKAAYSVVSLAGFVLIVWGYGQARMEPVVLYTPPVWLRHVALLLLVPLFTLFLATYLPGRIKAAVKHPSLTAIKLWALAHLLANGMLADVVLFGVFLVWAVLDRISMKGRAPRPLPAASPSGANDIIAVVAGLAIYAVFVFWLHAWLIGVSPVGAMGS
ncbi:MAG: NnrU family protein [Gammaproteobacteria bacterium]